MDGIHHPSLHTTAPLIGTEPRKGRFAYLAEREVWTNPPVTRHILCLALRAIGCADVRLRHAACVVDKFVWNEFGQPQAGPEARSAQG
jgi:hypothetical protein